MMCYVSYNVGVVDLLTIMRVFAESGFVGFFGFFGEEEIRWVSFYEPVYVI